MTMTNSTRIRLLVVDPKDVDKNTSKWNDIVNLTKIKFEYKTPIMDTWYPLNGIQDDNFEFINLISSTNSGKYVVNINSYNRDNTQLNLKIKLPTSISNYEFIIGNREREKINLSEYTDIELSQKICDELNSHLPVNAVLKDNGPSFFIDTMEGEPTIESIYLDEYSSMNNVFDISYVSGSSLSDGILNINRTITNDAHFFYIDLNDDYVNTSLTYDQYIIEFRISYKNGSSTMYSEVISSNVNPLPPSSNLIPTITSLKWFHVY